MRLVLSTLSVFVLAACSAGASYSVSEKPSPRRTLAVEPANCSAPNAEDLQSQPLVRVLQAMPSEAPKTGQCLMRFNVNPRGQTTDIKAECSHKSFENNAFAAIERFMYNPKIRDKKAVSRCGVEYRLEFPVNTRPGSQ